MIPFYSYKNGNYDVTIFSDGTKVRYNDEDSLIPEFPENIDFKISSYCDIGCPYCHEGANKKDMLLKRSNISELVKSPFFKSLHRGMELALGGGALSKINLTNFDYLLRKLKTDKRVFPNITINAKELDNKEFTEFVIKHMDDNIHGVGISYNPDYKNKILDFVRRSKSENIVIHTIYGVTQKEDYDWLAKYGFKVLILGYKNFRRGNDYLKTHNDEILQNQKDLSDNLEQYSNYFKTLSFDCLALEQLNIKERVSPEVWSKNYMGDDGRFTMYIDLPNMKYAKNSTAPLSERKDLSLNMTIEDIFKSLWAE